MTLLAGLTLPNDTRWVDEFDYTPVDQAVRYTLGGRAVVETALRRKGRPVTLDLQWITRALLAELEALRDQPGAEFPLTLADGRTLNVMFRHQDAPPIEAVPVVDYSVLDDGDFLAVKLKLMEI